jgi:uncharacterized protein YukE
MNLNIDTNALLEEVEKIRAKRERLNEIYTSLKKNNEVLKDNWNSKTSEVVFTNFEDFYTGFQNQLDNLQNDIDFLNALIEKYKEFESKNSQVIDEKITVQ